MSGTGGNFIYVAKQQSMSFVVVVLVGLVSALTITALGRADTAPSPWLGVGMPTLNKLFDLAANDQMPSTVAGLGNRDCVNQPVVTRPARAFQAQQSTDSCLVNTGFGVADSNGLMRFSGASVGGTSANYGPYGSGQIPIPASIDVLHYTSAGVNGLYLHLTKNIPQPISTEIALDGKITYRYTQAASMSLRDKSGALLPAQTDSLSFSSNGKWAVVDSPNRAMLRINLETLEALPFMSAFNYSLGISPGAQTAISNDGRYVMVASRTFGILKLYDLSTCGTAPNSISSPVACGSRDLLTFFQNQLPGFFAITNARFLSNDVLSLFSLVSAGSTIKKAKYVLVAPGASFAPVDYIGMGDSFSSGEGDNQGEAFYEHGTNNPTNKCHLSLRSYPYLLASSVLSNYFRSIACSGAVIANVSQSFQYDNPDVSFMGAWTPGYQAQKNYITTPPSFLTISIGGNDIGFGEIMAECATSHLKIPLPTTCRQAGDPIERANAAKLIVDQFPRLIQTYKELIAATDQKTKIYVVGYPKFVKGSGGSCGLNVRLNDQEREFVDRGVSYLNQVIKAAAQNAGVYYLDIESALEGRNLCSIVPDGQMAVNGLTEGDDKQLPWWAAYLVDGISGVRGLGDLGISNASYHPNHMGQRLMYEAIMSQTSNDPAGFSVCSTGAVLCPSSTLVPRPDASYFGQEAYDYAAKFTGVPLPYSINKPSGPARIVSSSAAASDNIPIRLSYLMPNAPAFITLDYRSTNLKQAVVGPDYSLDTTVSLPLGVSAGVHRLEVTTTNIAGEPTTFYQTIFVPGPVGDINNNATPDTEEGCGFAPPSGLDVDSDGIDDACDGTQAPRLPSLTVSIRKLRAK